MIGYKKSVRNNSRRTKVLRSLFFILFFVVFVKISAQDSLIISEHPSNNDIKNQLWKLPVVTPEWNIKNFTHTQVYFKYNANEFARKQTASKTETYGFSTEGLFSFRKDLKVFGNLTVEKIKEDKVPYTLSEERTDDVEVIMPHYFFVPLGGDWTNQKYLVNAGVIKKFFNTLTLSLKANFDAEKYNRTLDPRPEIINRRLGGELQLGYSFLNHHQVFGLMGLSQLKKDYSYYYSNSYLNTIVAPDTYLRFNDGYGRSINHPLSNTYLSSKTFFYRTNSPKFGGGYGYSKSNTLFSASYYFQQDMRNMYFNKYATEQNKRYQYRVRTHNAEIFFQTKKNNNKYQSVLSYNRSKGLNYDVANLGSHYRNSLQKFSFKLSVLNSVDNFNKYNFGVYGDYNQNKYQDNLVFIYTKVNSLNVGAFANKDFPVGKKDKINAGVDLKTYFPISTNIEYNNVTGISPATFINEVIFYDHAVNTTNHLNSGFSFQYIKELKNGTHLVFYNDVNAIFALQKQSYYYSNLNTDNSYRIQVGIRLNY
jgi:hypothetical protein